MKFIAKRDISDKITAGQIYYGNIIWKTEDKSGTSKPTQEIRIVVYNNNGRWVDYLPSAFEPVEE